MRHCTSPRRHARWALLALLALAVAAVASSPTVALRSAAAMRAASAVSAPRPDDGHAAAVVTTRAAEWAIGQPRGPQTDDHVVAVLLAAAMLLLAHVRRRAALVASRGLAARCGPRAGIRGPPAFV